MIFTKMKSMDNFIVYLVLMTFVPHVLGQFAFTNVPASGGTLVIVAEMDNSVNTVYSVATTGAAGAVTYTIEDGDPSSQFTIGTSSGDIQNVANPNFDFETIPSYSLNISADDTVDFISAILTVSVINVNELATITSSATETSILESVVNDTLLHTVTTTADPDGDTLQYDCRITPDDGTLYCDPTNGEIRNNANPEYTSSTYTVDARVYDGTDYTAYSTQLTLHITDVFGDPPFFRNLDNSTTFLENTTDGTLLLELLIEDPDNITNGDVYNVTILSVNGNMSTNSIFSLVVIPPATPTMGTFVCSSQGSSSIILARCAQEESDWNDNYNALIASLPTTSQVDLYLNGQFDFDTIPYHVILFQACDDDGCSIGNFTIYVSNGPDPPVFNSVSPQHITLVENSVGNQAFTFTWDITDPDLTTTFNFTLDSSVSEASVFSTSIDGSLLTFTGTTGFDYESQPYASREPVHFNLSYIIFDETGLNVTATITVYLVDVQEHVPYFPVSTYNGQFQGTAYDEVKINENLLHGNVYQAPGRDDDGGPYGVLTYTLDDASYASYFTINNATGVLRNWKVFDYDTMIDKTVFVTITATDPVGNYSTIVLAVTILPVNEHVPIFIQPSYTYYIPYDASIGTSIGTIAAIDPDATGIGAAKGEHTRYVYSQHDSTNPVLLSYWDGWLVVNGGLEINTTYTFYAQAQDKDGLLSSEVQINVVTIESEKYLVDWELNYKGTIDAAFLKEFESKLAATCSEPCTPRVQSSYSRKNGNKVLKVYMLDENGEPVTLEEIVSTYTSDNKKTPTDTAAAVSPSGKVVSINDPYEDRIDWLLISLAAGGGLLGFCGLTLALTALIDFAYCSRQPYKRQYNL